MGKYATFLFVSLTIIFFASCGNSVKNDKIVGTWENDEEKCVIKLKDDFTFYAQNVPLDVRNKYYLAFDKSKKDWRGSWLVENNQVKLIIDSLSYYYLNIDNGFNDKFIQLSITLSEESGGNLVFLNKR